jgi:CelD/BcsL family acetyltransferase involved in cellulose biosynthesis
MSVRACVLKTELLSGLERSWKELFRSIPRPSPFISYEWFRALARNLLHTDPQILVFYDNGSLVGLMPAKINGDKAMLLGDERVTDLNDIVCLSGYEERIASVFADFVRQNKLSLDLYPLEPESVLVAYLKDQLTGVLVEKKDLCPMLELPRTWDDFLAKLNGKCRHELRRKIRRINDQVLEDVQTKDTDTLFKLMKASDESKTQFLNPDIVAFFEELIVAFSVNGWLRMRSLIIDRRPAGMILAFALKDRVYLFNMGFDPSYRSMSPGIVTIAMDIRSAISEGYVYYDFLRGDEDYKYRLGAQERYTLRVIR